MGSEMCIRDSFEGDQSIVFEIPSTWAGVSPDAFISSSDVEISDTSSLYFMICSERFGPIPLIFSSSSRVARFIKMGKYVKADTQKKYY